MPTPNVGQLLAHPQIRAAIERALAAKGVRGDTAIVHVNPREEAMLRMLGGSGTINPATGLRQFATGGDPDAGGVGGSVGRGDLGGGGNTSGSNPGGYGHASDSGGGYGPLGVIGDIPDAIGSAISGIGGFLDRASGNFGQGWGSRGVAGGYGGAGNQVGAGYAGRGAGGGGLSGGHSGDSGYYQLGPGGQPPPTTGGGGSYQPPPLPPPVINNLPVAPPPLTPMMSSTATSDLAGGERFGALPSWATQPYQVGTAPSSYPTPGVNAGLGAPGYAGNPLPGQGGGGSLPPGGGGSGILGGGGGGQGGQRPLTGMGGTVAGVGGNDVASVYGSLVNAYGGKPPGPPGLQGLAVLPNGQTIFQALASQKLGVSGAGTHPLQSAGTPVNFQQLARAKLGLPAAGTGPAKPAGTPINSQQQALQKLLGGGAQRPTLSGPVMGGSSSPQKPGIPRSLSNDVVGAPGAYAKGGVAPAQQPTKQPATMTAAAKAAAAAKAKAAAAAAAKARTAARTGGKNFG